MQKLNKHRLTKTFSINVQATFFLLLATLFSATAFGQSSNLALTAIATHSGGGATQYAPASYNDNDFVTWGWVSTNGWIEYTWPTPVSINKVVFHKASRAFTSCTIEYWNGSAYTTIQSGYTPSPSAINTSDSISFTTVNTTKIRFNSLAGTNPAFFEIGVYKPVTPAPNNAGISEFVSPKSFCAGNHDIKVKLRNNGNNVLNNVNIAWTIDGIPQTPISWVSPLDTFGGSLYPNDTIITLGNRSFGNTVQAIKAWTEFPNFFPDTVNTDDTVSVVLRSALSGTFTIGGVGADYATIAAAANDLSAFGVCGPVVFNVNPTAGPYAGNLAFASIAGTSSINTITFNGNGATISSTVSPIVSFNNVNYVTLDSFTILGGPAFVGGGVHVTGGSHHLTFNRNTISVNTTATTTTNYGFAASGSPTAATTVGNNAQYITFTNNEIIGGYYSFNLIGNTGYSNNYGHHVANNIFRDFYTYGVYVLHGDSIEIVNNDVNRASRSTLTTLYAIYSSTSRFLKIQKNKLHDFGAASYSAYPIYIANCVNSTGYETEISNNLIYNVGQTAGIFYGIYSLTTALNNVNIYHNTIQYDVPTASTSAIRALFLSVAITNVNVKNNIINISGGGTGIKTGIYVTTASASFNSDNNNIIVNTTSNNNVGYWNAATRVSLADWQTASGQDANSNDINPQFTNLAAGNLKPLSVPLDNLGTAVGVTTDIDNAPRSLSLPDIGAYEFTTALSCSGTPDAGNAISNVSYACATQTINLNIDSATNALGLKYQWLVSTSGATGTYAPLLNDTLRALSRSQTTTNWYKCIVSCLSNYDTSAAVTVRTTTTPFSGTYTINKNAAQTSTNYTDFASLIEELKCVGVTGPVTFNVISNSGPYDAGVQFGNIPNASATNTITFNGNGNTITGSVSPLVSFNNTSYVTLDSFNIVGTTGYAGFGIHVTNQSSYLTFTHNVINVGTTSTGTTNAGFVASGSIAAATTAGNNARFITFTNNEVIGGYYSVNFIGEASYLNNAGHNISNNIIRDFYLYGVYLSNADSIVVHNNDINRANRTTLSTFYGIYLATARNIKVTNNKIHDAGNGTYTAYPVYVTTCVNTTGFETEFTNNTLYNINTTGLMYGYYLLGTRDGMKFYHNTIDLNLQSSTGTVRAIFISTAPTNHDFKNNIISIRGTGTGAKHLIYASAVSPTVASNYNVLHMDATGGTNFIGFVGANQTTLADWRTASLLDSNSVAVNPVFTASALGNLTPLSINADNIGTPIGVLTDINGNIRSTTTPDAGAYEFTGISGDIRLLDASLKRSSACYSTTDSIFLEVRNLIGSTVDFAVDPLTIRWNITGPVNSNGNLVLNTGTLAVSASVIAFNSNIDLSAPGTYNLTAYIEPNGVNNALSNDTLIINSAIVVQPILSVVQRNFNVSGPNDTVVIQANSTLFPGGGFMFTEVCHFKTTTGAPVGGWPAYHVADDYVEITGVPNSDLGGFILEQWNATTLISTHTFPTGTILSPNGTAIIAVGTVGASVNSSTNFYYLGNGSYTGTFDSGITPTGRILKNSSGGIIDVVTYSGNSSYTFPAAAGVTALDWSGFMPTSTSTCGLKLIGNDLNTPTNWVVSSATNPQDPNIVNTGVTVPSPTTLTGFGWTLAGSPVSSTPRTTVGPWTTPGIYAYVASYTNACGTFYDTVFVTAASTVPVKLATFIGKNNGLNADLMWQTATEKNARLFEVHASVDGKNFNSIGQVKATGNNNVTNTYTFTDVNALANNNKVYYKLK
ncbi:MAG: right-handed parallel beta-helix repeat-containing protein, partial [Chitinophagaceae bacterium]|nr:right-handed parallel beta-helix repeat-containing protein [Chitinophagaceae bacterium]